MLYQQIKLKIIMTLYIYGTFLAQVSFCHINTCISITKTQSVILIQSVSLILKDHVTYMCIKISRSS